MTKEFNIEDDVWFNGQKQEEEPYWVCQIFQDKNTNDTIYVAVDCNDCYVIGRYADFIKATPKVSQR